MLNFSDYTKRNHVTKAIRMELIPQGRTQETINEKGDKEYDKALYASLDRLKPVIDSFIRNIVSKTLQEVDYDFSNIYKAYSSKDKTTFAKEEKALNKEIVKKIDNALPKGLKLSQINSAAFLQDYLREYVLNTTDTNIKKDEAIKDIEETKGCLALFSKFLTTRITTLTTWMPERVVENFKIYCDNIPKIIALLDNAPEIVEEMHDELELMKEPSYYSQVLTQTAIDGYNSLLSGSFRDGEVESKSLNSLINEYNQNVKNQKLDKPYLRRVSQLNKQILVPAEKKFLISSINSDDEVRDVVKQTWEAFDADITKMMKILEEKKDSSDGNGIYIKGNKIHLLSHALTGEHNRITDNLIKGELSDINEMLSSPSLKPSMRAELEKRAEIVQNLTAKRNYEFPSLDKAILSDDKSIIIAAPKSAFAAYFGKLSELVNEARVYHKVLEGGDIYSKRHIKGDRHVQEMLVDFFSSLTAVREFLSIMCQPDEDTDADIAFYNLFEDVYENIRITYKAENLVRNYITKSVKNTADEMQTCFGTPARLRTQWWNGEKKFSKDHAAIIRHDNKFYYFNLAGDSKPVDIEVSDSNETGFLTLKKGQKSFMMLPKILFSDHAVPFYTENTHAKEYVLDDDSVIRPVVVEREIYDIYKNGLFKRDAVTSGAISEEQYKENIRRLTAKYIEFANAYVQYQKFNLEDINDPCKYEDIGEFFSDVDTCTSRLSWTNIDFTQIENLVHNGAAYLFLISNKFLYTGNENKNEYTKTLISILSDENMEKTTILLNSNPAIYFRPQAIKKEVTHKAGSIMVNRRTIDGEPIPKKIYETIYKLKNNKSNISEEDIIAANKYMETHNVRTFTAKYDKTYRGNYMADKYILQLTYTKNNDVSDRKSDMLNDRIINAISGGFNIVSVSRSTKDMVYVMVVDSDMKIKKEMSLNTIDGMDYYALLHDTYLDKKENKKAWIYDTENADLKSAYIDLAITEIIKLAREYNGVIVVESISDNVKNKYAFLDNQVFRAFENRIAQRLSDLTFKDVLDGRPGSVSNPLQLSNNNGNTYQDGILFYVNGAYTRGIDPSSGFTNLFDFKNINSITSKRNFFSKMKNITYDGDAFAFEFDYQDYPVRVETNKSLWTIKLVGDAVIYDRENKRNVRIKDIVNDVIIPLAAGAVLTGNVAEKILDRKVPGAFVEELFKWFRYAITGTHAQFNTTDEFYRSPIDCKEYDISNVTAYNLAKKLIFRLEYAGDSKDFTKEWLNYLQNA